MRSARIAWVTVVLAVLSLVAAPAAAAPTARERAEAKRLSQQAQTAFKRHRCRDAAEAYRRAAELDPSPQLKLSLARSRVGTGRLLEANALLSAVREAPATLARGEAGAEHAAFSSSSRRGSPRSRSS